MDFLSCIPTPTKKIVSPHHYKFISPLEKDKGPISSAAKAEMENEETQDESVVTCLNHKKRKITKASGNFKYYQAWWGYADGDKTCIFWEVISSFWGPFPEIFHKKITLTLLIRSFWGITLMGIMLVINIARITYEKKC